MFEESLQHVWLVVSYKSMPVVSSNLLFWRFFSRPVAFPRKGRREQRFKSGIIVAGLQAKLKIQLCDLVDGLIILLEGTTDGLHPTLAASLENGKENGQFLFQVIWIKGIFDAGRLLDSTI